MSPVTISAINRPHFGRSLRLYLAKKHRMRHFNLNNLKTGRLHDKVHLVFYRIEVEFDKTYRDLGWMRKKSVQRYFVEYDCM